MSTANSSNEAYDFEKLRKPIQDIIKFTNTIDERYREKCFEVLLNRYLSKGVEMKVSASIQEEDIVPVPQDIPLELQTFLQENRISEETVNKLFLRARGEARPIYKIAEKKKAVAQIQVALLTAFENALVTPSGALEFQMKTARQRCVDYNVYETDFINNFKNRAGLFTNLDNEVIALTPLGKTELAKLLTYFQNNE
ncbi:MAG: hypothetical protein NWE95_00145 [Candidatus Bathyarchaeota archaeon]|jgi:hypothetical protein|nr:hypothetical protein [Candidatus Bathyarchaeota archaeon]